MRGQLHPGHANEDGVGVPAAAPATADRVGSSSGVSWVTRMHVPTAQPDYWVRLEAEERLPNRVYPKSVGQQTHRPLGPLVKICLVQTNVDTSANFNWNYLHAIPPAIAGGRADWMSTRPARQRAKHDREGWQRMVTAGAPSFLGFGFGDAQTRLTGECMFGARFHLPADVTLGEVVVELDSSGGMLRTMGAVTPPPKG